MINRIASRFAAFALASGLTVACASESISAPDQLDNSSTVTAGVGVNGGGPIEVKCERRPNRSKASVDGNNLAAGDYRARVTSGGEHRHLRPQAHHRRRGGV